MMGRAYRDGLKSCGIAALVLATVLLFGLVAPPAALAVQPDEVLADAGLEARARELSKHLRCLVCQNQSIDDSDAELARDLRILVRERLKAGDSDEQVMAFLVARYGDFVLLKPPVKPATWLLWFGPSAIFALAGIAILVAVRRRKRLPLAAPAPLDQAERAALARILIANDTEDADREGDGAAEPGGRPQ